VITETASAPPNPRELRACGLAALAEAGVLALPTWLVLTETRGIEIGVVALAVPFVIAYVGGAVLACRFRAWRHLPVAIVAVAIVAGMWLGHGDANRTVFAIVVSMLVGLRLMTLALRDWRLPIHAEFGWFAVVLGAEVLIATGATPAWRTALIVVVPVFFVAGLASRASTVWTTAGAGELDDGVRAAWIRRAIVATGALLVAMIGAVALSVRGGVFDRIGAWLAPAADALASFFAALLGQIARPIFWLIDRLGIDPQRVRDFFDRLREGSADVVSRQGQGGPSLWQRLLGLLAFAAIGYGIYRMIRRFRPPPVTGEPEQPVPTASLESAIESPDPIPRPRFRREPPADRVRRWYAEALETLGRRGVRKDPWLTPAEFVPAVAEAYPSCATAFGELTHAYEDVRYGNLRLDGAALDRLQGDVEHIASTLRRDSQA
jgi:hypothetical protein